MKGMNIGNAVSGEVITNFFTRHDKHDITRIIGGDHKHLNPKSPNQVITAATRFLNSVGSLAKKLPKKSINAVSRTTGPKREKFF